MGVRISVVVIICLTLFPLSRAFGEDAVSKDGDVVKRMTITQEGNSKRNLEQMMREHIIEQKLYSVTGAWALSFFIGLFTPFLGAGQYFTKSYATAVPTMMIGFASTGCAIVGLVKKDMKLVWIGEGVFAAAWLFDWIYAIVATKKLNERIRREFESGEQSSLEIRPLVSYGYNSEKRDHVLNLGLTLRL